MTLGAGTEAIGREDLTDKAGRPGTVAVFLPRRTPRPWEEELRIAVQDALFQLPRYELSGLSIDGIATWLDRNLPNRPLTRGTRDELISDVLSLALVVDGLTATQNYKMRIFAAAPDRRCGYHVDTVPPGVPVWGALKIYNGDGTDWIAPNAIRSMAAFYEWLQKRDQIVQANLNNSTVRDIKLQALDARPSFFAEGAEPQHIPARTTIVFRHLSAAEVWTNHETNQAWVHASPMGGGPRLVVTISPDRPALN